MIILKCNKCGSKRLIGFDDGSAVQCDDCDNVIDDKDIDNLYESQVDDEIKNIENDIDKLKNVKKELETQLAEKPWKPFGIT